MAHSLIYKEQEIPPNFQGLLKRLGDVFYEIEESCKPNMPIQRSGRPVGWGINGSNKAIACDCAISILKEIKSKKGW